MTAFVVVFCSYHCSIYSWYIVQRKNARAVRISRTVFHRNLFKLFLYALLWGMCILTPPKTGLNVPTFRSVKYPRTCIGFCTCRLKIACTHSFLFWLIGRSSSVGTYVLSWTVPPVPPPVPPPALHSLRVFRPCGMPSGFIGIVRFSCLWIHVRHPVVVVSPFKRKKKKEEKI